MENFDKIKASIQNSKSDIKSILNLGSGTSIEFFDFLDNLQLRKLVYVDKSPIFDDLKFGYARARNISRFADGPKSPFENEIEATKENYDLYKILAKERQHENVLDKDAFNAKTHFDKCELGTFLKNESEKFDLIVFSKVLSHLSSDLSACNKIIELITELLTSDGILFLKVNGANYWHWTANCKRPKCDEDPLRNFNLAELKNLIGNLELVTEIETKLVEGISMDKTKPAEEYWVILKLKKETI